MACGVSNQMACGVSNQTLPPTLALPVPLAPIRTILKPLWPYLAQLGRLAACQLNLQVAQARMNCDGLLATRKLGMTPCSGHAAWHWGWASTEAAIGGLLPQESSIACTQCETARTITTD
jgi:hypothetical protein